MRRVGTEVKRMKESRIRKESKMMWIMIKIISEKRKKQKVGKRKKEDKKEEIKVWERKRKMRKMMSKR